SGRRDVRAAVSRPRRQARPRRPDRGPDGLLRADGRRRSRPYGVHRIDGLAAERRRHDVLLSRGSAEDTRRGAGRDAQHHRKLGEIAGVEVTGRVDDVRPHIARGAVYVVPLRIGGGTRLKIFEAMSMGKAVVSTAIGAEGLPVTNGRDIVIADEASAFADA